MYFVYQKNLCIYPVSRHLAFPRHLLSKKLYDCVCVCMYMLYILFGPNKYKSFSMCLRGNLWFIKMKVPIYKVMENCFPKWLYWLILQPLKKIWWNLLRGTIWVSCFLVGGIFNYYFDFCNRVIRIFTLSISYWFSFGKLIFY